jgi:CRISPR system Cascade subunit CasE
MCALEVDYLCTAAESKPLQLPLLTGQRLQFRLRANPTKRVAARNERLGGVMADKRVGLAAEAEQLRWLLRKGDACGFRIPGSWLDAPDPKTGQPRLLPNFRVDMVGVGKDRNDKPNHGGALLAVRFEGVLIVTDPAALRASVAAGISSGMAFGFGLLSLAPAQG